MRCGRRTGRWTRRLGKKLRFGAFMSVPGCHPTGWRHPDAMPECDMGFRFLARTAERGKLDAIFFQDSAAVVGSVGLPGVEPYLIKNGRQCHIEPVSAIAALAAITSRIGLISTCTTTYNEPFNVARRFLTNDHISGGRAGWNLVTSQAEDEAQNFGCDGHLEHGARYDRAAEFLEVVRGLWDSWEDDAFVRDKASGQWFDPDKMHILKHEGPHFRVRGPLNVTQSPQGWPVVAQAGSSAAGRDTAKLAGVAGWTGFSRVTTDLDAALASATGSVLFDAAPSGLRGDVARRGIAAGMHLYLEKPVTGTVAEALSLHRAAVAAGVKAGTIQDKLFLPGFSALLGLRRAGFFGTVLEVRVEMGRWIHDGFTHAGQRPSWNYRKKDGGGLILDMFPHWRYMIDALAGEVRGVSATSRRFVPRRVDERGTVYDVDVEDSVFANFALEGGGIASINSSWCTRARREFPIQVQIDGTDGSAVAGPFGCWSQAEAPGGPIAGALPQASLLEGWDAVPVDAGATKSYRAGWELFLRHVAEDGPMPYSLLQGAKGVQLAQCAYRSDRERRWVDVPALEAV